MKTLQIEFAFFSPPANLIAASQPTITLVNSDCARDESTCSDSCLGGHCWSGEHCQLECDATRCDGGCRLDTANTTSPSQCCTNPLCLHCTRGAQSDEEEEECVACSSLRDLTTGRCVAECPRDTLVYAHAHSCVRRVDCSRHPASLVKAHHVLDDRWCVSECPASYRPVVVVVSSMLNYSRCEQCDNSDADEAACVSMLRRGRDCSHMALIVRRAHDLAQLDDCDLARTGGRLRRLHIELGSQRDVSETLLAARLQHVRVVDEQVTVVGNRHLRSLAFLASLRRIEGHQQRFALVVHSNRALGELWPANNLTIVSGAVNFYANPHLCYAHIEQFVARSLQPNQTSSNGSSSDDSRFDAELASSLNGQRRRSYCQSSSGGGNRRWIELEVAGGERDSRTLVARWRVDMMATDVRRLRGFVLAYALSLNTAEDNHNEDDEDEDEDEDEDGDDYWTRVYVDYDEMACKKSDGLIEARVQVAHAYRWYAVRVRADVAVDHKAWMSISSSSSISASTSTQRHPLASRVHYVRSPPSRKIIICHFVHLIS